MARHLLVLLACFLTAAVMVSRLGLVSRFFDFLGLDEANNNVHNIRLCRQIVAAGAAPASLISELQAVDKVF